MQKILTHNGESLVLDLESYCLNNSNKIFIQSEINDELANKIILEVESLDGSKLEDLYVIINSPGGSITSGLAIFDTLMAYKKKYRTQIITVCRGIAASMAAILFVTLGDRRIISPNSSIMLHQPILNNLNGKLSDIKGAASRAASLEQQLLELVSERTNQDLISLKELFKDDCYLYSNEAVVKGFADEIEGEEYEEY